MSPEMAPESVRTGVAVGFIVMFLIFIIAGLIVKIFYILTLQKALSRCAPQNQAMAPGMVWLLLIPLFSIVWNFFVVLNLAKSLGQEFRTRGMNEDAEPGKTIGLIMCICIPCSFIPYIGFLPGIAALVLWIIYWVQMAGYSRKLESAGLQNPVTLQQI
jgi:hypothetical protein